jgi:3-oxoadipate enol-lactonase
MLPRMLAPETLAAAPEVVDRVRAVITALPVAGIVGALAAMRDRPDSTPILPTLGDLPTLVIVGEADEATPPEQARAMAEAIPGAHLVVIPGAGHLPSVERPAATTKALQEFLGLLG